MQLRRTDIMAMIPWDRLLETCYRRGATDLLLFPGSSPMIRLEESWRALDIGQPLGPEDVAAMAEERIEGVPDGAAEGCKYRDFQFGDVARFRAMAFGYPHTTLLLVVQHRPEGGPGHTAPVSGRPLTGAGV